MIYEIIFFIFVVCDIYRHCNKIAEFCVLWKCGLFINQGPVDVFIQQDWNDKGEIMRHFH